VFWVNDRAVIIPPKQSSLMRALFLFKKRGTKMSNTQQYLPHTNGGRWTISREVDGRWIAIIQNTPLFCEDDAVKILEALKIIITSDSLDTYFPINGTHGRCPTLELLELFSTLGTKTGSQIGV
jgi:hypothetical protein